MYLVCTLAVFVFISLLKMFCFVYEITERKKQREFEGNVYSIWYSLVIISSKRADRRIYTFSIRFVVVHRLLSVYFSFLFMALYVDFHQLFRNQIHVPYSSVYTSTRKCKTTLCEFVFCTNNHFKGHLDPDSS